MGRGQKERGHMPLKTTDSILSKRGANPRIIVDRLRGPSVEDYEFGERIVYWSQVAGVDAPLALSQWLLETGNAESPRWTEDFNSSGIGIVSNNTAQPMPIPDADHSARLHVQTLYSMVKGKLHPDVPLWEDAEEWMERVWLPKVQSDAMPEVKAVSDLGLRYVEDGRPRATWSWEDGVVPEDTYGKKLASRAQEFYPEAVDQSSTPPPVPSGGDLVFGNAGHPPFLDRLIPDDQTRRWDSLGQRRAIGVCQHSMIGTLWGTDGFFRQNTALTDYGIGGSTDKGFDGVIIRWNDPIGAAHTVRMDAKNNYLSSGGTARKVSANRSGWANGGSDGLEGDGVAYVRKLGVSAINRDLVSIERSDGGNQNTAMSQKQFDSICLLTAHWFDFARVPWDMFPLNPSVDLVTHMLHLEFATKNCPFPPVTSRINEIQDRIRAILKAAQTLGGSPTVPVPPVQEPDPDTSWPHGWTTEQLSARFGRVKRINPDGTTTTGGFDVNGVISNAWVARADQLGITNVGDIPKPLAWYRIADAEGLEIDQITFDGRGSDNWLIFRPAPTIAWRWIEV
jgi:hypothetical protein